MDEAEFTQRVVPCVSKLFTSTDRSIRRSLLENIDAYGQHLSQVRPSIAKPIKVHMLASGGDKHALHPNILTSDHW